MTPRGPLPPLPARRGQFKPVDMRDVPLEVIFEEEEWVVVCKPSGLLSVPGLEPWAKDSASERVRALFPRARGGLVAHRLDMATSGLMVFALSERALSGLSQSFAHKRVHKRYLAVLGCSALPATSGALSLPMRLDPHQRPIQVVDFVHGKPSLTRWRAEAEHPLGTLVSMWPVTGRTHQLRLHAAHPLGLNAPIVGDSIYHREGDLGAEGRLCVGGSSRLLLHATSLSFDDPCTGERRSFEATPAFISEPRSLSPDSLHTTGAP